MIRQGNVNKHVADVCKHRQREVTVAIYGNLMNLPKDILFSFLRTHNLIPTWHDTEYATETIETLVSLVKTGIYLFDT